MHSRSAARSTCPPLRKTSGPPSLPTRPPGSSRRDWRFRPRRAAEGAPVRPGIRRAPCDQDGVAGRTFNALDYAIEARDGGTAHLRYVHSGILADDWADQYDAIDGHTDFYLHTLSEYLEHFNGRPVTYVGQPSAGIEGPKAAGTDDAMELLSAALGIAGDATAGDAVHADLGEAGCSTASLTTGRRPSSEYGRTTACTASSGATSTAAWSG